MPSLTQDPRFGSQADQQTDKESNPHGYNSIGTKYVDYGLGANPNPAREGLFRKEEFHYDAQNDVYICPGNQQLHPRYRSTGGEPDRITAVRLWVAQRWIMPLVIGTYE